jgi:hypothetical protein
VFNPYSIETEENIRKCLFAQCNLKLIDIWNSYGFQFKINGLDISNLKSFNIANLKSIDIFKFWLHCECPLVDSSTILKSVKSAIWPFFYHCSCEKSCK